jgi:hypothetical protein
MWSKSSKQPMQPHGALNDGAGSFAAAVTYPTGPGPHRFATADLNGDGRLDLAIPSNSGTTIDILLGNGDGTFGTATPFTTDAGPVYAVIGDLNSDGKRDLVTASPTTGRVSVLMGNGNGTFAPHTSYAVGARPFWIGLGDVDVDGDLDLAVSNYGSTDANSTRGHSLGLLLNNGNGSFSQHRAYAAGRATAASAIADLDADGRLDFVTADALGNTISILLARCVR